VEQQNRVENRDGTGTGNGNGTKRTLAAPPPRRRRALCWCSTCWLEAGVAGFKASVKYVRAQQGQSFSHNTPQGTHPSEWPSGAGLKWAERDWTGPPFANAVRLIGKILLQRRDRKGYRIKGVRTAYSIQRGVGIGGREPRLYIYGLLRANGLTELEGQISCAGPQAEFVFLHISGAEMPERAIFQWARACVG
jgi:hypothetical protein